VPLSIVPGTVSYLVLAAVARGGPLHGFAILRWIERASDVELLIEEGALYPALHQMEADGWLVSDWAVSEKGRRAKYYDITTAGEKALRRKSKEWTRYIAAVRRVATAGSDTE
jgi:PadR family transcriptional regulator PadR